MSPLVSTLRLLSLAWLGAVATPLAGEAAAVAAPDSSPPAAAPAPPPSFKLTGYAEGSYVYASKATVPNIVVGHLYDRYSNAFYLNAFKLTADRPFDPKKVDAGVHADLLVGQNAEVVHSSGSGGTFNLGLPGELEQMYVTLNIPTADGNGVQFKVGKMVTLMGLEVIEDVANPVWSEGNQFTYVENFTSTGVEFDAKPSSAVDIELRVSNGWDRIVVTDGQKDFMGRIGITAGSTSLGLLGYYGDQEANTSAARYGAEALLTQKMGKSATLWIQGDYGKEKANAALPDPTVDATWWAVGGWLSVDLSSTLNFSARGDYLNDAEGARTAGAFGLTSVFAPAATYNPHKLWTLTGNLNIKTFPGVFIRPEIRYDHSSYAVFDNGTKGTQIVGALSVAFQF
jgi:putative OmpL-like beta-barrel porin-2